MASGHVCRVPLINIERDSISREREMELLSSSARHRCHHKNCPGHSTRKRASRQTSHNSSDNMDRWTSSGCSQRVVPGDKHWSKVLQANLSTPVLCQHRRGRFDSGRVIGHDDLAGSLHSDQGQGHHRNVCDRLDWRQKSEFTRSWSTSSGIGRRQKRNGNRTWQAAMSEDRASACEASPEVVGLEVDKVESAPGKNATGSQSGDEARDKDRTVIQSLFDRFCRWLDEARQNRSETTADHAQPTPSSSSPPQFLTVRSAVTTSGSGSGRGRVTRPSHLPLLAPRSSQGDVGVSSSPAGRSRFRMSDESSAGLLSPDVIPCDRRHHRRSLRRNFLRRRRHDSETSHSSSSAADDRRHRWIARNSPYRFAMTSSCQSWNDVISYGRGKDFRHSPPVGDVTDGASPMGSTSWSSAAMTSFTSSDCSAAHSPAMASTPEIGTGYDTEVAAFLSRDVMWPSASDGAPSGFTNETAVMTKMHGVDLSSRDKCPSESTATNDDSSSGIQLQDSKDYSSEHSQDYSHDFELKQFCLNSSNIDELLVRESLLDWNIAFTDLKLSQLITSHLHYSIYRGRWHGDVRAYVYNKMSDSQMSEFVRDVTCLSRVRHDNVCLFMAACFNPPTRAIVTSDIRGASVYDRMLSFDRFSSSSSATSSLLSLRSRVQIIHQVAQAVDYLHAKSITVRTALTSRSIYLEPNVKLALLEHVIVGSLPPVSTAEENCHSDASRQQRLCLPRGAVCYLAPEVLRALRPTRYMTVSAVFPFNEHTDVFAFGTLIYELVRGEFPWRGLRCEEIVWITSHGGRQSLAGLRCNSVLRGSD